MISRATPHARRILSLARQQHAQAQKSFHGTHRHAKRLLKKVGLHLPHLRQHAHRITISGGAALISASAMAATPVTLGSLPNVSGQTPTPIEQTFAPEPLGPVYVNIAEQFPTLVQGHLPEGLNQPSASQEEALTQLFQQRFGVTARAQLEGNRLNVTRGRMFGEQHLPLYPGDSIEQHRVNRVTGEVADPTANLTGMVPGLPSWGYFAPNAASVTAEDVAREQWYIAAQTFLAPGWDERTQELYKWFKYRKVLVVNPETGQAVVACIGDAGPSPRLNRHFGGSNEVLIALDFGRTRHGEVVVFFIDDPNNQIPLGPLTGYNP